MRHATPRIESLRAALTDAARDAIAEAGHEALRMRALAEVAGCSAGHIYNAFPDVDALLYAVKAEVLSDIGEAVRRAAEAHGGGDATEGLVAMAVAYHGYATANLNLWRMLFNHRPADEEAVPDWYQDHLNAILGGIDAPLAAAVPGMAGDALPQASRTLFSAVHGVVSLGVQGKFGPTPRDVTDASVRLVTRAFVAGLAVTRAGS